MKVKIRTKIRTACDDCQVVLREDNTHRNSKKKTILYQPVFHLGNGRHKCKDCFKKGMKSKWKFNLNPLEEV